MPLVSQTFSATLMASLMGSFSAFGGGLGKDLKNMCDAIAGGIDLSLKTTATFTTTDIGFIPLCGGVVTATGTGTGIIVSPGAASSLILAGLALFTGPGAPMIASSVDTAFVTYASTAMLSSVHTLVYEGSGTASGIILSGSIIKANILAQGALKGFIGKDWPTLAGAIADGISGALQTATATVTISGIVIPPICPPAIPNKLPGGGTGVSAPAGAIT
jgi:hypothetical protein